MSEEKKTKTKAASGEKKAPKKAAAKKSAAKASSSKKTSAAKKTVAKTTTASKKTSAPKKAPAVSAGPELRLKQRYYDEVRDVLVKEFGYKNPMAIPKVTKVAINMGMAEAKTNIKLLDEAVETLTILAGQKPVIRRSRKAISNFKLRENMPIGTSVTIRGARMWQMLDRLFSLALPRVRDFRGLNGKAFDGRGNYTLGIKDQLIFPEVDYGKVTQTMGMNITIVTTANTDAEARSLLAALGMPFKKARK